MNSIHNIISGIAKLTHSPPNLSTWQKDTEVILKMEDLFGMVDGSTTQPTDPAQLLSWQEQSKCTYAIIYLLFNPDE